MEYTSDDRDPDYGRLLDNEYRRLLEQLRLGTYYLSKYHRVRIVNGQQTLGERLNELHIRTDMPSRYWTTADLDWTISQHPNLMKTTFIQNAAVQLVLGQTVTVHKFRQTWDDPTYSQCPVCQAILTGRPEPLFGVADALPITELTPIDLCALLIAIRIGNRDGLEWLLMKYRNLPDSCYQDLCIWAMVDRQYECLRLLLSDLTGLRHIPNQMPVMDTILENLYAQAICLESPEAMQMIYGYFETQTTLTIKDGTVRLSPIVIEVILAKNSVVATGLLIQYFPPTYIKDISLIATAHHNSLYMDYCLQTKKPDFTDRLQKQLLVIAIGFSSWQVLYRLVDEFPDLKLEWRYVRLTLLAKRIQLWLSRWFYRPDGHFAKQAALRFQGIE